MAIVNGTGLDSRMEVNVNGVIELRDYNLQSYTTMYRGAFSNGVYDVMHSSQFRPEPKLNIGEIARWIIGSDIPIIIQGAR